MIIVRLCGGLGNQMFQYAAGRRLALMNGVPLKLDLCWFDAIPAGDTKRMYELKAFDCIQQPATPGEVRSLRGADLNGWPKLAKKFLKRTGLLARSSWVREKQFHFDPEVLQLGGEVYLDGYWVSEKYFDDVKEQIRKDFTILPAPDPVNREFAERIQGVEAVSLHIRRGDYVSNPSAKGYHGLSPLEYYHAAVSGMTARVKGAEFFAFSDDPAWVKENLRIDAPLTCLEHNGPEKAYEDLRLMSLCKHHIIANSTFSWWGAWLSRNPGKIVFAPKRWFLEPGIETGDLIPPSWVRL